MAYFRDGTRYAYHRTGSRPKSRNAGWLDASHKYSTGTVPPEFVRRLILLAQNPVNHMRGCHFCDLCPPVELSAPLEWEHDRPIGEQLPPPPHAVCRFEDEEWTIVANGEIRVAEPNGTRWTAPTLIVHYVLSHNYRPPAGFVTAVLTGSVLPDPQRAT